MDMTLFSLVEQYDVITIFRHISADSDALGSQFGLKQWIQDRYPNKKVYALGNSVGNMGKFFPAIDEVSDDVVASSLAIVLDTANQDRVDDQRFKLAQYRLKIDHHLLVDRYCDYEIVEDIKGATCEILASMMEAHKETLSPTCAQYFYTGLIADTLQFSISTIRGEALRTAAYLIDQGVDVALANEQNFSKTYQEYRFETYLRGKAELLGQHLPYVIVEEEEYKQFGLTLNEAKDKVYIFGKVFDFEAWCLFIANGQKTADGKTVYNGSLRSKHVTINDIANRYHGGGHRYACGVKNLTKDKINLLLNDLLERINTK